MTPAAPPSPSSGKRKLYAVAAAGLLFVAVSVAYVWYMFFGPGRFLEAKDLTKQLAAIPGVAEVELFGHEDLGFEIESYTLEIEGHGPLSLARLEDPTSDRLDRIHIYTIGEHVVTYAVEGHLGAYLQRTGESTRSQGWGTGFTVGVTGAHAGLFPFPLHSVTDVIEHYAEICDVISAWPVQPDYDKLIDSEGVQWFYALADPALDEQPLDPSELKVPE